MLERKSGLVQPIHYLVKRITPLFVVLLTITCQPIFSYDSLGSAIRFHQSSQYRKALPIFIDLAKKFKAKKDLSNYALCQTKIADIIRTYGGSNVALEILNANENLISVRLEKPSLLLAQNFIAKGEAYYSLSRLTDFKHQILKSIDVKKTLNLPQKYLAEDYMHLARYYKEFLNQNDSCHYWVTKSLLLAKSDKDFSLFILPRIYNLLGYYYHPASNGYFVDKNGVLKTDSLEKHYSISLKYYDSALLSVGKQKVVDKLMVARIYNNLGNSYSNQLYKDHELYFAKALHSYRKGLNIVTDFGSPSELALKHWVIGTAFHRNKMLDSALVEFSKGLKSIIPNFNTQDVRQLPPFQPTLSDSWFAQLVKKKADIFFQKYNSTGRIEELTSAYHHYIFLLRYNHYLISKAVNERENSYRAYMFTLNNYEPLVEMAAKLSELTNEMNYVKKVYSLIAKSKYAYLNRNDIEPAINSSIQSSVLKEEIILVRKNIFKSIPALSLNDLNLILPTLPPEKVILPLSQINLARQINDTLSISELQHKLERDNSALLDMYFSGDKLFTIAITKDAFDIIESKIPKEARKIIWKIRKNSHLSSIQFASVANKVYNLLLDSSLRKIPEDIKRIVICPDGELQTIPWDALVTDTIKNKSFRELQYLLKDFTIRTTLTPSHLLKKEVVAESFYGIASDFSKSKRFSEIPFSVSLIKERAIKAKGKIFDSFKNDSLKPNIFHLSGHVINDSLHPYNSFMYFSDKDSLRIASFSNSKIRPKLVILNGCQTGRGMTYSSEGTVSFARTSYTLGAQSVLMTLWDVDDKTTAEILAKFYDEIEEGNDLDISLRQAKLDFIEEAPTDELANPYYWAGLQLTGKAKPIYGRNYQNYFYAFLVIIGCGFVLLYMVKRHRLK